MSMEGPSRKERSMNRPMTEGARRYQEALERGDTEAVKRMKKARLQSLRKTLEAKKQKQEHHKAELAAEAGERRIREEQAIALDLVDKGELVIDPTTGEYIRVYEPPEE